MMSGSNLETSKTMKIRHTRCCYHDHANYSITENPEIGPFSVNGTCSRTSGISPSNWSINPAATNEQKGYPGRPDLIPIDEKKTYYCTTRPPICLPNAPKTMSGTRNKAENMTSNDDHWRLEDENAHTEKQGQQQKNLPSGFARIRWA